MPYENLRELGRLHVDPFGNLHICQGISVGSLFSRSLGDIFATYDPEAHPITGPLLVYSGSQVPIPRSTARW